MHDSTIPRAKDADSSLASSIRANEIAPTESVIERIIAHNLAESANAAIQSLQLTESLAIRLVSHFNELLDVFISNDAYATDSLRKTFRNEVNDETIGRMLTLSAVFLEGALDTFPKLDDKISKYFKFVSVVVDSKFLKLFVKSGSLGGPLSRLMALVCRYRQKLFAEHQLRMKSEGTDLDIALKRKTDPKVVGKIFYCDLK